MTLYRFHVRTDEDLILDGEGVDLPDLSSALREALRSAREFRSDADAPCSMHFEIADPSDQVVLTVPIYDLTRTAHSR